MDGYSVEEAAEVLGIPQGRVWELIARGVLAGASEGRSDMRVFLKPPAGSGSPPPSGAEDGGARANGGTHVEASPFRELLTEFRNLTERYGQALLALGEARGEVAALRSRVEVLEARMDMRLPLRAASTVAWELPDRYASERGAAEAATEEAPPAEEAEPMPEARAPSEPTAETAPGAAHDTAPDAAVAEPQPLADEPGPEVTVVVHAEPATADEVAAQEPEPPKRRVSGGRAAIAGLAEALARAEDPTLADLPGAREAGEALAALQRDVATTGEHEEGPEQPAPPAPEPPPGEPEPMVPDIPAAFATPMELPEEPAPEIPEPAAPEVEMPTAELPMPDAVAVAEPPGQPEPAEPPEAAQRAERAEPAAVAEPETVEAVEEPRPVEPASPYTTEVVEPDWFADGDFTWLDAGTADMAAPEPEPQEEPEAPPEPETPTEAEAPSESERSAEEEPTESEEHEAEHIEAADEGPSVEAIQDAFSEAPTADEPPPAEHEAEHIEAADEGPSVGALQDAFSEAPTADEPPAAEHEPQPAHPWPAIDRGGITSGDAVGFNLFREPARPPEPPAAERPPSASAEEELLWFGDEFEAADLEMETPGWRAGDRVPAEPATATVPTDVEPTETIIPDEEIERLAGDEGWDDAEVDAIRAYLGRTELMAEADVVGPPSSTPPAEPPSLGPDGPERTTALLPDQDWLRGRHGPAATAYRRLRRLFQG